MAYATTTDLETHVGATLDTARAQQMIDAATAAVDMLAGRNLEEAEVTETIDGAGTDTVLLHWPVSVVSSVALVDDDGTEETLTGPGSSDLDYRWSANGWLERVGDCWPARPRSVKITYTAGFPAGSIELASAKGVVLRTAAQMLENPASGKTSESIGDWSASWETALAAMSAGDKEIVSRFRSRRAYAA